MSTLSAAPAATWQLDPVHSSVGFAIDYLGGTFAGELRDVEASLATGEETSIEGVARVAGIDVKDESLAAHLQGPDFFDAERHPELRFTARGFGDDGETLVVDGDVTIKGVTLPVRAVGSISGPVTDPYGRERISVELAATIDRTAFGVSWNTPLPSGEPALAAEVAIRARLFFVQAA